MPENIAVGIQAPKTQPSSKAIYDLSGRKVSKAQKGVFITEGKKIAVK